MTRPDTTNKITQIRNELEDWVNQSPEGERRNRKEASELIIECWEENSASLTLRDLALTNLPTTIGYFTQLERLDLSRNQLTELPSEIGNLTWLQQLDLCDNQLTELPSTIKHFTQLRELYLLKNSLAELPREIENLTRLRNLDLSENLLTELPSEIGNLTWLQDLNLSENRLARLPSEIGNITWLKSLNLSYNHLTTIPDSLFYQRSNIIYSLFDSHENGLDIDLENNHLTPDEAQRIDNLARENGITVNISIYEPPVPTTTLTNTAVKDSILELSKSEEEKTAITEFLSANNFENFNRFLSKCSETAGWLSSKALMSQSLYDLINKMREEENGKILTEKCLHIAETALGTCGDRVALAYARMMVAKDITQKPVNEMTVDELFECAKAESITKFLNEKAEEKVSEIKVRRGYLDEIETHLAYLQAAPQLGLELPGCKMLYQRYSNVDNQDILDAINEFGDPTFRAAQHAYEDNILKRHPLVNQIITEKNNKLDSDLKKDETEAAYLKRMKTQIKVLQDAIVEEIHQIFEGLRLDKTTTEIGEEEKKNGNTNSSANEESKREPNRTIENRGYNNLRNRSINQENHNR